LIVPLTIGAIALVASTFVAHHAWLTVLAFTVASAVIMGAVPVFFSLPATFLKGTAAATGFALACSLANIAGLVSNSLIGWVTDLTGSGSAALWLFAGSLMVSCLLAFALPAKQVNR
jgi:nitrate/nitrite transporter NarK